MYIRNSALVFNLECMKQSVQNYGILSPPGAKFLILRRCNAATLRTLVSEKDIRNRFVEVSVKVLHKSGGLKYSAHIRILPKIRIYLDIIYGMKYFQIQL